MTDEEQLNCDAEIAVTMGEAYPGAEGVASRLAASFLGVPPAMRVEMLAMLAISHSCSVNPGDARQIESGAIAALDDARKAAALGGDFLSGLNLN